MRTNTSINKFFFNLLTFFLFINSALGQESEKDENRMGHEEMVNKPDWIWINKDLTSKFGQYKADSITLESQIEYYWKLKQYPIYMKHFMDFVEKFNMPQSPVDKNLIAWRIFEYASEKAHLNLAFKWVSEAQNEIPTDGMILDTYCNLLYKLGRIEEALLYQQNAIWLSHMDTRIIANLYLMNAGIPTWKYPLPQNKVSTEALENSYHSVKQGLIRTVDSLSWSALLSIHRSQNDSMSYAKSLIRYIEEFKPCRDGMQLNEDAWSLFLYSKEKSELKKALLWSGESIKDEKLKASHYAFMDTHANLLYKLGRKDEAIKWAGKALALCPEAEKQSYEATLTKMRKGEPNWPKQ